MATGILRIQAFAARQSAPVEGVTVNIVGDGFTAARMTDAEGNAADVLLCNRKFHIHPNLCLFCQLKAGCHNDMRTDRPPHLYCEFLT